MVDIDDLESRDLGYFSERADTMKTINKVTLLGNLGRDVEMRHLPNGEAVANLAVATSSEWKDRESGEKQQATEWHRCVAFGKLAELIGQYCSKGSSVYLEGKLRTRKWQDAEGVDRYTTEVVLDEFINLDKRQADQAAAAPSPTVAPSQPEAQGEAKPVEKKASAGKARK